LNKLRRLEFILEPGDLLVYSAWTWHAVENVGDDPDELVVTVSGRYSYPGAVPIPAFKANPILSTFAFMTMMQAHPNGSMGWLSDRGNLQPQLEMARSRQRSELVLKAKSPAGKSQ
jgi:hypothetical protein